MEKDVDMKLYREYLNGEKNHLNYYILNIK